MTTLAIHSDVQQLVRPEPRSPIGIRVAVPGPADLKFIDDLQKKHSRMVGFLRTGDIEKYIAAGGVLIAEESEGLGLEGLQACHDIGTRQASKPQASKPV